MTAYYIKHVFVTVDNKTTTFHSDVEAENELLALKKADYDLDEVEIEIEFVEKGGRHSAMKEDFDFGFLECTGSEFLEEYC